MNLREMIRNALIEERDLTEAAAAKMVIEIRPSRMRTPDGDESMFELKIDGRSVGTFPATYKTTEAAARRFKVALEGKLGQMGLLQ
jgi:hypothetical protein